MKLALIGSSVETVVTASLDGPTRLPTCVVAAPAMPSMGEVSLVKPRLTLAVSTAAVAAAIPASAASICALAVSTCAFAAATCAFMDCVGLRGVIEILLRDRLLLGERSVAILIQLRLALIRFGAGQLRLRLRPSRLGLGELRLGLRQLPLRLIDGRLERPGIDLKQQLALADEGAFGVVLREQIAGHLALMAAFTMPSSVPIHSR